MAPGLLHSLLHSQLLRRECQRERVSDLSCAAASATFAGLLFVALSLHLRIVVTHPEARSLARITLSNQLRRPACIAIPFDACRTAQQTGIDLMVIAVVSLALIAPPSVRGIRARRARTLGLGLLISRFGLSMLGCIVVGVLGALFYLGSTSTAFTDLV